MSDLPRLLYSRAQVQEMLGGVSIMTLIRLEKDGKLTPRRLTGKRTGQVFYKAAEIEALVEDAA